MSDGKSVKVNVTVSSPIIPNPDIPENEETNPPIDNSTTEN